MKLSELPVRPLDHLTLTGRADDCAVDGRIGAMTYGDLEKAVGRLASCLRQLNLPEGARAATWATKSLAAVLMPLACARAGLVHVPVNPVLKHAQVAHILRDCGARLLTGTPARLATLTPSDLPGDCASIDEERLLAQADALMPLPPGDSAPDSLASILYTSGSTGLPKGVMLSHANMWLGAISVAEYLRLTPDSRVLSLLPLSFDYGQNQLFSTWAAGGAVVPMDYLMPREVVKMVERWRIDTIAGVPPLWVQLTEADWPVEVAARLRRLTNSGGALTGPLVHRLRDLFPAADIYAMYGLTEAFRSTYLEPELLTDHAGSIGRAIPHAEILICRPDGSLTDTDEPGELVHCGPLVAQGYWNDPERTAQRFRPAPPASRYGGMAVWSGDHARRDAQGLLYFIGRNDEMIKTSGNRVSPTEVEGAALAVPGVVEAAAFGVADARLGQAIHLVVRASVEDEDMEQRIRGFFRQNMPNYMMPAIIDIRSVLPRNANGKLDRADLRAEIGA